MNHFQPMRLVRCGLFLGLASYPGCTRHDKSTEPVLGGTAPTVATARDPSASNSHKESESRYEARLGKEIFQHYCLICHGKTGLGDGFNSYNLHPRPRNLADPTFLKAKSNSDLEMVVKGGGARVGLSNTMPPWGQTLTLDQVQQVLRYVRSQKIQP